MLSSRVNSDNLTNFSNLRKTRHATWKSRIEQHILSFPLGSGKYNRSDSPNALYLSTDLNMSRMYTLFKDKYTDQTTSEKPPVSLSCYRNVFKKIFNYLHFKRPKTDTCETFHSFHVAEMNAVNTAEKDAAKSSL